MRLLVIGGSGYVGGLVLPGLAAAHRVRVLDLRPPETSCEFVSGDATDPAVLADACAGTDAVLHMAMAPERDGAVDPAAAFDVHVKSVYLAVAAAAAAGVGHVVFTSSMSVFSDLGWRTIGTGEEPDARDPYGLTKRLGEEAARAAAERTGTALTVLRLSWPTPDDTWPAWGRGLSQAGFLQRDGRRGPGRPAASPDDPLPAERMADGTPMPALAAADLTAALLAALDSPAGVRTLPLTGDTAGNCVDLAPTREALRGWWPTRT